MKTTNYEISKQLAEAGFKDDFEFGYTHDGQFTNYYGNIVSDRIKTPAYDLETLLEALPSKIARGEGRSPTSSFIFTKDGIGYAQKPQIEFQEFINQQENESLADTAARLWLKLKQEGFV